MDPMESYREALAFFREREYYLREYVDKAATLTGDKELVAALYKNLRGMMQRSPLMDAEGYVKDAEALYQRLWVRARILKEPGD